MSSAGVQAMNDSLKEKNEEDEDNSWRPKRPIGRVTLLPEPKQKTTTSI